MRPGLADVYKHHGRHRGGQPRLPFVKLSKLIQALMKWTRTECALMANLSNEIPSIILASFCRTVPSGAYLNERRGALFACGLAQADSRSAAVLGDKLDPRGS